MLGGFLGGVRAGIWLVVEEGEEGEEERLQLVVVVVGMVVGIGDRERSCDLAASPAQLEDPLGGFREGSGVKSHVEAEMDGLRGRIRRLTGEIREVRKAFEEMQEEEVMARLSLFPGEKQGDGCRVLDTYLPSSPILSSLSPIAKERGRRGHWRGILEPDDKGKGV